MKYYKDNDGDIWVTKSDKDPNIDNKEPLYGSYCYPGEQLDTDYICPNMSGHRPYILLTKAEAFIELL